MITTVMDGTEHISSCESVTSFAMLLLHLGSKCISGSTNLQHQFYIGRLWGYWRRRLRSR